MIKKFLNWIKGLFTPKEKMDPHEVVLHPRGFCSEHNKYKHRCPKCKELARMI
jgi:hypothetical protein